MLLTRHRRLRQLAGVLETANLLFLRLVIRNPAAAREFPGRIFRTYAALGGATSWTSREIFDVLPRGAAPGRIVLEHLPGEGINTSVEELAYLALVTQAVQPKHVFEIGTFRGRTALNFALNSPPDCVVWTLDLPPDDRGREAGMNAADSAIARQSETGVDYRGKDVAHKIRQLYGNSLSFDFEPYAGQADIVFVDGAHHYGAVVSDTMNALRLVRPGGVIIWHDFANYGDYNDVTRGILACIPGDRVWQIGDSELAVYRTPKPLDSPGTG